MSREIKFRGKRIDNGEWAYGTGTTDFLNVYGDERKGLWLWSSYTWIEVNPATVGMFTGLHDKKRTKAERLSYLTFAREKYGVTTDSVDVADAWMMAIFVEKVVNQSLPLTESRVLLRREIRDKIPRFFKPF